MDAAGLLSDEPDLRRGLCLAGRALLQADLAALWELRGEGRLECTATTAPARTAAGMVLPVEGPNLAVHTLRENRRVFVADARAHPAVSQELVVRLGMVSLVAEPLRRMGAPVAVLVMGWRQPVQAIEGGAADRLSLLSAAGGVALQALQRASRLEHLALTDDLTGLPNRRHLEAHLQREVARAQRRGSTLGVAALDLDDLKEVNDREGHQAGDALLRSVSTAWRTHLRAGDLLARTGGDEFVLVLPDCGPLSACVATVERVRSEAGGRASAGVATWLASESPGELLRRADEALYAAKREGRRRTVAAGQPR